MQPISDQTNRATRDRWPWLGPLLFMVCVGIYFVGRYAGRWAEADSTTFTSVIRPFVAQGRLVPGRGVIYPNGYSYQALSASIMAITGLDVVTLQQLTYPLLASLVVLPAWALYRELTGSARGATLTTMLLFTQPEFLFVILRSSHEKFTRTLMVTSLYLLVRSFKLRERPQLLAAHIGLFYLVTFACITSNNLLAHSFIFTIAAALVLGRTIRQRQLEAQHTHILRRLTYACITCLALTYLFTFYIYPPAEHDILVLQDIRDRVGALFLDVQATGGEGVTNAYAQVETGWLNLYTYFAVSIANWIILAASFAIWSFRGVRWLVWGEGPRTIEAWLVWLFYAAFVGQGGLSALADASGALSSNLQHRLFPSFSLIAVAVVGTALSHWHPPRYNKLIWAGLTASVGCVALLSVMKATNEPLLSNKWTFYRSEELVALDWYDAHLEDSQIWTDFDERLVVAYANGRGASSKRNLIIGYIDDTTRHMLGSSVNRLRASRLGHPLPIPPDALRVYDNGDVEIYHVRPRSPYQK